MINFIKIFFLLVFCFRFSLAQNNSNSFKLLLSGGIVGSQVDGDAYGGYNKAGVYGGIFTRKPLDQKSSLEFGLTYIQKGSRKNINAKTGDYTFYLLRLNYVELPLIYSYAFKDKYLFQGGLSMALIVSTREESHVGLIKNPFKANDFCYQAGMGYKTGDNLYFGIRYSYSLLPVREFNATGVYLGTFWTRIFNQGLYNNLIHLSVNYVINPKQQTGE